MYTKYLAGFSNMSIICIWLVYSMHAQMMYPNIIIKSVGTRWAMHKTYRKHPCI